MKKNKTRNLIAISTVALVIISIVVVLAGNKKEINQNAEAAGKITEVIMPVKVATLTSKTVSDAFTTTGSFEARKELPLTAEVQGSITALNVREGDRVSAGQTIARIDASAIKSNYNSMQAAYNKAVKDAERYKRLAKAGAISKMQYEDTKLSVENAAASLAGVRQQMNYTTVKSPMSGTINELKIERGSFATLGMKIGSVVDVSKLKMVVKVPEDEVLKIRRGQAVTIQTDVYPQHPFSGAVTLISVTADEGRKYDVEVEVPATGDYPLKAGMFGAVTMSNRMEDTKPQTFIPRKALVGSIKRASVFVVQPAGTVQLQPIEVQNTTGDEVIVISGLPASAKVVVSGQINLKTGDKVRVVE